MNPIIDDRYELSRVAARVRNLESAIELGMKPTTEQAFLIEDFPYRVFMKNYAGTDYRLYSLYWAFAVLFNNLKWW